MKKDTIKAIWITSFLVGVTFLTLSYATMRGEVPDNPADTGVVHLKGALTEEKILMNGDGRFGFSLEMTAEDVMEDVETQPSNVDMVIVLDQSGSMSGSKIDDARQAILKLLAVLSSRDRFGLVGYADQAKVYSEIVHVTPGNRSQLESIVRAIRPEGGTNLGAGLSLGMRMHDLARPMGNNARIVLVSDGLANQGIVDPESLTAMANQSAQNGCPVSAVGVGNDFNEMLMTGIADRGLGGYYFLETPDAFFHVFSKELSFSKTVAASSIEVRIPLQEGLVLESAGGYPISVQEGCAVFYPGEIRSGTSRKLYLKFRAPVHREGAFSISDIQVAYRSNDEPGVASLKDRFQVTCTSDREKAYASINKEEWEQQVLQDDYNTLKEEVAMDVKAGKKSDALKKITAYRDKQETLNAVVGSARVAENLTEDLGKIEAAVNDTFEGTHHDVARKQKTMSKVLQFEAYQGKRDKK